jgi:hypothetical protein
VGHSDISWKFEIIGSWVGQGDRERGQGFKLRYPRNSVATKFRMYFVLPYLPYYVRIPRNFRQFHTEYGDTEGSQKTTSVDTLNQAIGREMAARRN